MHFFYGVEKMHDRIGHKECHHLLSLSIVNLSQIPIL